MSKSHASKSGATTSNASPSSARRILIVEDNEDSALSLKMLLEALGYVADVVHDGESAIAASAKHRPDIILMDIGLPGVNGYEAARQIRQSHAQPEAPRSALVIIALTGWGQEPDRRRSQDAGIDHHLVKPLDLEKLRRILEPAQVPGAG